LTGSAAPRRIRAPRLPGYNRGSPQTGLVVR
jgi:hypothetical protein